MQSGPNTAPDRRTASLQSVPAAAQASYANFCRVTGSPEEVLLDFALLAQPQAAENGELAADHRVVLSPFTAKRMLGALIATIRHYEQTFGPIEIDARNRVRPTPVRRPASPATARPRVEPIASPEVDAGETPVASVESAGVSVAAEN